MIVAHYVKTSCTVISLFVGEETTIIIMHVIVHKIIEIMAVN